MSNYKNYRDYILDKLDERTLLEQPPEEAIALTEKMLVAINEQ